METNREELFTFTEIPYTPCVCDNSTLFPYPEPTDITRQLIDAVGTVGGVGSASIAINVIMFLYFIVRFLLLKYRKKKVSKSQPTIHVGKISLPTISHIDNV